MIDWSVSLTKANEDPRRSLSDRPDFHRIKASADDADTLFVSFPKSGRTWVRFVLETYKERRYGVPLDLKPRSVGPFGVAKRVFFTEDYFDFFHEETGKPFLVFREEMLSKRLIVLVREPRDTIISYFHWIITRNDRKHDMKEFIYSEMYGIERMSAFVLDLLDLYDAHEGSKHLIIYEDAWSGDVVVFSELLKFIDGSAFDAAAALDAITSSRFDKMQKLEMDISRSGAVGKYQRIGKTNWSGDANELKVRKGGLKTYLDDAPWLDAALGDLPMTRTLIDRLEAL